ncbi:MAG: hypothetical protein ACRENS_10205 [Candidatus Eiseniibacteriota bacterium]
MGGRQADAISEPDMVSWWSAPGRPGWTPEADLGTSFAWTFAGHSLGAWSRALAEAPSLGMPWPEAPDARRPLVWSDSLAAACEPLGAWLGPDAALSSVTSSHLATHSVRARSVFRIDNGDFGVSRYSLTFERGDSLRWLRYQASSGTRGGTGALGPSGDHVWDLTGSLTRGAHTFSGSVSQRGAAQELKNSVIYEDAGAQSGRVEYRWAADGRQVSAAFARGLDRREDVINGDVGAVSYSRRDAQENRFELSGEAPALGGTVAFRGLASKSRVIRSWDDFFEARDHTVWGALSYQRLLAPGALRLELGGGRSTPLDRRLVAPSASFTFGSGAAHGRVFAQRLVHPVWSDLAPAQAAFLQSTTALGLEAEDAGGPYRGRLSVMGGTTRDRAIVFPYPIQDIWLRAGTSADPNRYDFALFAATASVQSRMLELGAEAFALARDQAPDQPRPEPDQGGRGWLETRFRLFLGDLGVRLRLEGAQIGARDSYTGLVDSHLPGYWTGSALATFTLSDVTAVFAFRNLENQRHTETWIDPSTGQLALSPGRQFRLALTWRLMN